MNGIRFRITRVFCVIAVFVLSNFSNLRAQENFSLENYVDLVLKYHPYVKQAELEFSKSKAFLKKRRGAFDPVLSYDQKEKNFGGTNYYSRQKTEIKIPSFYGITLNGSVQQASGVFLNPEDKIENDQLIALGASFELGQGLLSNPRQTALKQAKLFTKQANEENALEINRILTIAIHAYLDWYKDFKIYKIFDEFVANASFRFEAVKQRVKEGDLAKIDSTEARIALNQRKMQQQNARLELQNKVLNISNFMWLENQPIEIRETIEPFVDEERFLLFIKSDSLPIEKHPKLTALSYKKDQLVLEKRLQKSNLAPKFSVNYQWLSDTSLNALSNFSLDPDNNITGIKAAVPLFLRKERADLKIASLKVENLEWEQLQTKTVLENRIKALFETKERLRNQENLAQQIQKDYQELFEGEQKKFLAGESSLFLVNTRESKLIEAILKTISLEIAQKKAEITYYFTVNFPSLKPI